MTSKFDEYTSNGFCAYPLFSVSDISMLQNLLLSRVQDLTCSELCFQNLYDSQLSSSMHQLVTRSTCRFLELPDHIVHNLFSNPFIKQLFDFYKILDPGIYWTGSLDQNLFKQNAAGFRIVRPLVQSDVARLHVDRHIGGRLHSSNFRFFSLWLPLNLPSLLYPIQFVNGSHTYDYSSSGFNRLSGLSLCFDDQDNFTLESPTLTSGEVVLFDSNTIHGNGFNHSVDSNRISLEIRFYSSSLISSLYKS
tara:strand:+ start:92 stop:838 length:747 start_codon:yes stop_codon:yes gene_type:complete